MCACIKQILTNRREKTTENNKQKTIETETNKQEIDNENLKQGQETKRPHKKK